jgi:hypothetical protein
MSLGIICRGFGRYLASLTCHLRGEKKLKSGSEFFYIDFLTVFNAKNSEILSLYSDCYQRGKKRRVFLPFF